HEVLGAVHDLRVSFGVHIRHVAGSKPAVGGEAIGVDAAVIAGRHPWAAYLNLADTLAVPGYRPAAVHVGEPQLDARQWKTLLESNSLRVGVLHGTLDGGDCGHRRRFGHAPPLVGIDAVAGRAVLQSRVKRRTAVGRVKGMQVAPGL